MANILRTPTDCQFYVREDPYNFVVDCRPLFNLLNNDLLMNADLEAVIAEVLAARVSIASGTFSALKPRIDALENALGTTVSISDMTDVQGQQYGSSQILSEVLRQTCPSGFLDFGGIADPNIGDAFSSFAGVRTTASLGVGYENSVVLWTGWGSAYRPVRAQVNGWIVRLFNEATGSPATTPAQHVTIGLGAAPATGKYNNFVFLEVWLQRIPKTSPQFYSYGAVGSLASSLVTDHLDPTVVHTIKAMAPGGDWLQLRHRIRVVQDYDPATSPFGFGSSVLAQGGQSSPVTGHPFTNMQVELGDVGLWRAGDGTSGDATALGSYDGYVYAVPIFGAQRHNSGSFAVSNQNGTRIDGVSASGYLASGVSGHPDGLLYDAVSPTYLQDLRQAVSLTGFDYGPMLDKTWEMLARGELHTNWKQLSYDYDESGTWVPQGIWGHVLTYVDEISNTAEPGTNPQRDLTVAGNPLALPDGQRNSWGRVATTQLIKFRFTQGSNASATPAAFVTYQSGTGGVPDTLTFNAAGLSGAGVGGTKISTSPPVIMLASDISQQPTLSTQGLGSQTAVTRATGLVAAATYVGYIQVVYPAGGGLTYPQRRILTHQVIDGGVTTYPSQQFGITGSPGGGTGQLSSPTSVAKTSTGKYVQVDQANHRVVLLDPTTGTPLNPLGLIVGQFGVTGVSGADNTHLSWPTGVACDASGNVYVCDTRNHRIVKLSLSGTTLSYTSQFGVTGVSGADNTHCNLPMFCATDTSFLYFADSANHRLVKLTLALAYSSQFGTTGVAGSGRFGLSSPVCVATVSSGFGPGLWVTDPGNARVVILNGSLSYSYQIASKNNMNTLSRPNITSACQDAGGNIYVCCKNLHTVTKYSPTLATVAQFGQDGVPGTDNTHLQFPSGICVDNANGWLYVADGNQRVVRLALADLTYNRQFGVTGATSGYPLASLASGAAAVAVDSTGNVYFTQNDVHCVTKLDPSMAFVARFGTYGVPNNSNTSLRNPLGIAVKPNGSLIMVADTNNNRIVVLNGSLAYVNAFSPVHNLAVTPFTTARIYDVSYSTSDSLWYVTTQEIPTGTGVSNQYQFAILKFADTPSGTPNYTARFLAYDWPVSVDAHAATTVITGTASHGVAVYSKPTPTSYSFTSELPTTVLFNFADVYGISASTDGTVNGNLVLVTDRAAHVIYCFDGEAAIFRGTAGILYESGDDDGRLSSPSQAVMDGKYLLVVDTGNQRLLRRHRSSPWVSSNGTISSMIPPVGADKIRLFYSVAAYQGVLGAYGGGEAVYKDRVLAESPTIYATTLGLGSILSSNFSSYSALQGLTFRLPLPNGWTDFDLKPVGLHSAASQSAIVPTTSDDGPYLALPVVVSEGLHGGQINVSQEGGSSLTSREALQQVVRTVGGVETPRVRGFRSVLPRDQSQPSGASAAGGVLAGNQSLFAPVIGQEVSGPQVAKFVVVRFGTPMVSSFALADAVAHFTYYPFLYRRQGQTLLGVIAVGSNGNDVGIGDHQYNSFDAFYPVGRPSVR